MINNKCVGIYGYMYKKSDIYLYLFSVSLAKFCVF